MIAVDAYDWLPVAFMLLMGLAVLAYVILDGFDLGVGVLSALSTPSQRDTMIASIGPFWDANETWLVMGVGLLLVAFPQAHGMVLGALYLPVSLMLVGLTARGVAFDFRGKVPPASKPLWDRVFTAGSLLASACQGYMLGRFIVGFDEGVAAQLFAALVSVCLLAAYAYIGAAWLIIKTEGALQRRAVAWATSTLWLVALGVAAISIATPLVSERVFERWFALPQTLLLAPIPVITIALLALAGHALRRLRRAPNQRTGTPFVSGVALFVLCFFGLAYSFWPFVVPEKLTMWEAASARESLKLIFVGVLVVLPMIIGYTIYVYRVFRGKARVLRYD